MKRLVLVSSILLTTAAFSVTVVVDGSSEGMGAVSWSQVTTTEGIAKLMLKATASDGCVFAGWYAGGAEAEWRQDSRLDSLSNILVPTGSIISATFVRKSDDSLTFDVADQFEYISCGVPFETRLNIDSFSFPTLTISGLPVGLSFDKKSLVVSGTPTTPGVYKVKISGKNVSGYTFVQSIRIRVGNISGTRISGNDINGSLGKYMYATFEDMFNLGGETNSVSLTVSIPGMIWNPSWQLLYGTPTKAGIYPVKATAVFKDGTRETATMLLTIASPDPSDYGVELDALDWLAVGDVIASESLEIGTYSGREGILSVSGLPTGLSVETWNEDGVKHYGIKGTVRSADAYTVVVKVSVDQGGTLKTITTSYDVIVGDTPSIYFETGYFDDSQKDWGTVLGGGPVSVVSPTTVRAIAKNGFVFAGWYDEYDEPIIVDSVDYRSPSMTFASGADLMLVSLRARFVPSADDGELEFNGLDGSEFEFDAMDVLDETFAVISESMPTLTFKGLPPGVSVVPLSIDGYRLVYDAETAKKTPSPGRYTVTATAVNASKVKASATFVVTVANIGDPRIRVDDDYGDMVPGEEIVPIDLSDAVDFARGETLTVSGLPKGLTFNKSANTQKGILANTVRGIPTTPGDYTVTFSAKVVSSETTNMFGNVLYAYASAKATAFMRVLPYPELVIGLDDEVTAAGCMVTGGGRYKPGTKVTLKASAAKGWVFAGWEGLEEEEGLPFAALAPTVSIVTGGNDSYIDAVFISVVDDGLEIFEPSDTENGFAAEFEFGKDVAESGYATFIAELISSISYPSISVSGLPPGVKFNASTFLLSGKPTKSGVYYVTVAAKNAGGYVFTRVLRMAVLGADGSLPLETQLPNHAGIDFSPISSLVTGTFCADGDVRIGIGNRPDTDIGVKNVSVSGAPAGLKVSAVVKDGQGEIRFVGTPSKAGRFTMTVTVTYTDGKSAKSQYAGTIADGGAYFLAVESAAASRGTVSGSGVYASGATVKIAARAAGKCVFAGWLSDPGMSLMEPFEAMQVIDGIDYRSTTASFPFRPDSFNGDCAIYAGFLPVEDDAAIAVLPECGLWEFSSGEQSSFGFSIDSFSLPVLTTKGLPKGVSVDLARGRLVYDGKSAVPGIYVASLTAKNQSAAIMMTNFEVRVANVTTEVIHGLDADMDAYPLVLGTKLRDGLLAPVADDGWTLSASGLPSGLSFKNGVVSGVPLKSGDFTVKFVAVKGGGATRQTETATVVLRVSALPETAVGTFNGYVKDTDGKEIGTLALTATATGKISASVKTMSGMTSFSAKSWNEFDPMGVATAELSSSKGDVLAITLDTAADWMQWQVIGECVMGGTSFPVCAQRNPFGAKDGVDVAKNMAERLAGKYNKETVHMLISKNGNVTLSGTFNGAAISGSTVLIYDSGMKVDYIKVLDRTRTLKILVCFDENAEVESWDVNFL